MKKDKVPSEKGFFAWLAKILGHEKWTSVTVPIFTIILTLIVSSIFLLILGKNPFVAFYSFLAGNGFAAKASYGAGNGMMSDFFAFLNIMAPMLLAALAFIFAYRCGLFNIGIAGQMLLSGFMATILVGYNKALPAAVAKPLVIIVGLVVGGLLGAFVGFLKYRFNIHEVVSTIMINYIISFLTGFFINSRYVDSITRSSKICSSAARLTWTKVLIGGYYCNVPLGIVVALIMVFVVKFIFDRTVFGFDLRAVGSNRNAATVLTALKAPLYHIAHNAGMDGSVVVNHVQNEKAGMGYDAIATALLGNNTPVGAIFASVLITIFQNGANYMSSTLGVAKEIASVITGILLLFSACSGFFRYLSKNKLNKIADEKRALERVGKEAESK